MIDFLNYILVHPNFKIINLLCIILIIVLVYTWNKIKDI